MAQVGKIVTAGMTASAVFGLVATFGWSAGSAQVDDPVPTAPPVAPAAADTATAVEPVPADASSSLQPVAPAAPIPVAVPAPVPAAPIPVAVPAPAPPPPAPAATTSGSS